jgi:hypothetical protein
MHFSGPFLLAFFSLLAAPSFSQTERTPSATGQALILAPTTATKTDPSNPKKTGDAKIRLVETDPAATKSVAALSP